MSWTVLLDTAFEREFAGLPEAVQDELLAHAKLLEIFGPQLGRPRVDTLKGSKHANMKELRFDAADGVWRVAFAFDPKRRAILLVAEDKAGRGERRFYKQLIEKADKRFDIPVAREYFGKRRCADRAREQGATRRNSQALLRRVATRLSGASGVHRGEIFMCDGYI